MIKDKCKNINRFLINKSIEDFSQKVDHGENVLDIGAGSGHYRSFFRKNNYLAIDIGLEQSTTQGLDVVGDICFLPFKDSSFKNALCIEVLEHVWDSRQLFQEFNRVLESNGKLLLTVPLCFGEHMQPYDFYRYTRFSLTKLLETHGFKIIKINPRGGYFALLGYLISKIPDQIMKSENINSLLKKSLRRILRILLTYILTPLFLKLDYADTTKSFTLGYICEAKKVFSLHSGKRA